MQNYDKDWHLYLWRTKEGEEIDFLIITATGRVVAIDAKMSRQAVQPVNIPAGFKQHFPQVSYMTLVTLGGNKLQLSPSCLVVPIVELHDFLATIE